MAITGATGFVGWHVASAFLARGAEVVALHRRGSEVARLAAAGVRTVVASLSDPVALAEGCAEADVLIHAAAAVDFSGDWQAVRAVNVGGTSAALAAAQAAGVRRVVHVSSIAAVGATRRPIEQDEDSPWTLEPLRAVYATTKREAEVAALAANGPGLDVVVVNPGCVVGPDDFTGSEFGTLCHRFWRGRLPVHFAGGNNFVDVRDVAEGIVAAAERGRPGQRYLLTGENQRWPGLFAELSRAAGRTIPRLTLPAWLAPPLASVINRKVRKRPMLSPEQARLVGWYFFFSSAKAQRELGFAPRQLRETLADAYAFWEGGRQAA